MSWIKRILFKESTGRLRRIYDRVSGPSGQLDNVLTIHSLRPHTLEGHLALYKNTLHHGANTLTKSFRETVGVYVSALNGCRYCVEHHFTGLKRLLEDDDLAERIRTALESNILEPVFNLREQVALRYVRTLTQAPYALIEQDINDMRQAGYDDGQILEINQVAAYFSYANRTVLGLGVQTDGEVLGLSPSDASDPDNMAHE
ncbi:MAG: alkylhydroperoxidase [Robiginitomaculum sp.]|nr:MAG: alkylhydroperoxidase [Robiginitomaculum sp.]